MADPLFTLLFEGLWLLADREGRLEDRPLRIKGDVFPYRNVDVEPMLQWLEEHEFVRRYSVGGKGYIQICEFVKHQNPHKNEPESVIPPPDGVGTTSEEIGSARADSLIPDSGFLIPESTPQSAPPPAPPSTNKAKKPKPVKVGIPEDFGISERVKTWAAQKGYGQLQDHLEAFKRKAAANGYRYADWDSAFMEAIREDWAKLRGRTANGAAPPAVTVARHTDSYEETQRLLAERSRGATAMPAEIRQFAAQLTGRKAA